MIAVVSPSDHWGGERQLVRGVERSGGSEVEDQLLKDVIRDSIPKFGRVKSGRNFAGDHGRELRENFFPERVK